MDYKTLDTITQEEISRRRFLSIISRPIIRKTARVIEGGLLAFMGINCTSWFGPPTNHYNPNFRGPGLENLTFLSSIYSGWSPAVSWKNISERTPILAVADGIVGHQAKIDIPGHAKGLFVDVAHKDKVYYSGYGHLVRVIKHFGDSIERGEPIGYGGYDGQLNCMIYEEGNLVNFNNYGPNHGFPEYFDGRNFQIQNPKKKLAIQKEIVDTLTRAYRGKEEDILGEVYYTGISGFSMWSYIELFRNIEKSYKSNPDLYNLNTEFAVMKQRFYDNQAMRVTMPF